MFGVGGSTGKKSRARVRPCEITLYPPQIAILDARMDERGCTRSEACRQLLHEATQDSGGREAINAQSRIMTLALVQLAHLVNGGRAGELMKTIQNASDQIGSLTGQGAR
jgi:hypothetical protein